MIIGPTKPPTLSPLGQPLSRAGGLPWDQAGGKALGYLLDYSLADTMTRATEAAFVDPRPVANGGTGSYAWDFPDTTFLLGATLDGDITAWTDTGTPTEVTGVADPWGGTTAVTTGDDDAGAYESHTAPAAYTTSSQSDLQVDIAVLKDTTTDRFPEFGLTTGGVATLNFGINTQTGATATRTTTGYTNVNISVSTHPDSALWWLVRATMTAASGGGALAVQVWPARATTLGSAQVAAVGTLTWVPTIEVSQRNSWKLPGAMRIFSDGAILIEGARTNDALESHDYSSWGTTGTPVLTAGQASPDGGVTAYSIEDDDGAAHEGVNDVTDAITAGANVVRHWVKKDAITSRFPEFQHNQGAGGFCHVQINTSTGATTIRTEGTWTATSVTAHDAGDWWILELAFTTASTATITMTILVGGATSFGGAADVAAVGTITVWGSSVEAGAFASSPIRTSGAAATRNADDVSWASATAAQVAAFNGSWYIDYWPQMDSSDTRDAVNGRLLDFGGNKLSLYNTGATGAAFSLNAGGTIVAAGAPAGNYSAGDHLRLHCTSIIGGACSVQVENITTGATGTLASGSTGGTPHAVGQKLTIGNYTSGAFYSWGAIGRPVKV